MSQFHKFSLAGSKWLPLFASAWLLYALQSRAADSSCKENCSMPAPIVFFDMAGPQPAALRSFYADVFGWKIGPTLSIDKESAGIAGTIRKEPAEKILYLGVPDVTAALKDVVAKGGTIDAPRFEVPGVVVLGLFRDPAGNRMGLVEMEDGKAKVPRAK